MTFKCYNCGEEWEEEGIDCPLCFPNETYDEDEMKLYIRFDEEQCI